MIRALFTPPRGMGAVALIVIAALLPACQGKVWAPPETGAAVLAQRVDREEGRSAAADRRVYRCGEGYRFEVEISASAVTLVLPEGRRSLERVRSASGEKYVGEGVVFWHQGDQASIETPQVSFQDCRLESAPKR